MKRALLSVSDKRGLVELARGLQAMGVELVSTGGTARALTDAGLTVRAIEDLTGFPEMLDGRVKTLHPAVHAGILYRRELASHRQQMRAQGLSAIDLVVVNLYPFRETVRTGAPFDEVLEQIDIGGPTLLRAAAKNHEHVVVLVDPDQYEPVLHELQTHGQLPPSRRLQLAAAAFRHVAAYDATVARVLSERVGEAYTDLPRELTLGWVRRETLRYGENPHQPAAVYVDPLATRGLALAVPLQGKALSYNNLNDAQAALNAVREFSETAVVAVKHATPCGVGVGDDPLTAYRRAYEGDPISIFGGIVAINRPVDGPTARALSETFLEVVLAPAFLPEAREVLAGKKNLRLLEFPIGEAAPGLAIRLIDGGAIVQEADRTDRSQEGPDTWRVVAGHITDEDRAALWFAWRVVKHVRSNAIVVATADRTLGIDGGQTNRIDAARHALTRAGAGARGAVLASDAFFPFPDVVEAAAAAGIRAIVQPGGSQRDEESIAAAERAGIAMCFTGRRHFLH